jgi:hypothetical protein
MRLILAFGSKPTRLRGSKRRSELYSTQDIQHSFQVVNQRRQADLCLGSGQAAQQKAWVSEDTVLQRGERKLHRHCSQPHDFRRGALLHALQGALM